MTYLKFLLTLLLNDGTTRSGCYTLYEPLEKLDAAEKSGRLDRFFISKAPEAWNYRGPKRNIEAK